MIERQFNIDGFIEDHDFLVEKSRVQNQFIYLRNENMVEICVPMFLIEKVSSKKMNEITNKIFKLKVNEDVKTIFSFLIYNKKN